MITISFKELTRYLHDLLIRLGMSEADCAIMTDIYMETTKRGVGHHDIYNFPSRVELLKSGQLNPNPVFTKLSSYGAMERWDGDNGTGEIINHFSMRQAMTLADQYGIGMCAVKNSNHYLCSAPFVLQAARQGYIGFILAKGVPSMGVPGVSGKVIGQSPIGYAFPVGGRNPVMMDICLAYASGEQLEHRAADNQPVPSWWGVDREGHPTTSARELINGTKYPIGEHKGFGLAILSELLTGVLSGGQILDAGMDDTYIKEEGGTATSHTAFAIKVTALMPLEEYHQRSRELVDRILARAEGIHIPGDASWEKYREFEEKGEIALTEKLLETLNQYAQEFQIEGLT